MKRVTLYALAVFLVAALWPYGTTDARQNPENYISVFQDSGEDHPWGGEQHNDEPGVSSLGSSGGVTAITGLPAFDMFFWKAYSLFWLDDESTHRDFIIIDEGTTSGTTQDDTGTGQTNNIGR